MLIIEDNDDIREALRMLIEMRGYCVITAVDGPDGCRAAKAERPDLILMDLALPGMNGEEATREIRCYPESRSVPIVCVTSYARGHVAGLLAAGVDQVMSKTDFIGSYHETLRKYLGDPSDGGKE